MARYTAVTKLPSSSIIERAMKHFAGMTVKSKTSNSLCLESPDGYVTISVCKSEGKKNELNIETGQFDAQVKEFIRSL